MLLVSGVADEQHVAFPSGDLDDFAELYSSCLYIANQSANRCLAHCEPPVVHTESSKQILIDADHLQFGVRCLGQYDQLPC